jgi:hypothetical protein
MKSLGLVTVLLLIVWLTLGSAEQLTPVQISHEGTMNSIAMASMENKAVVHRRGCCSHHKGVCGCENGRTLCCDGKLSPSCRCD